MIFAVSVVTAILVAALLTFTPFAKSEFWKATITPLASIIGSGFLVCAPLLAREFGSFATPAMGILLLIAYLVGEVMRFNIVHVEPILATSKTHDAVAWVARIAQGSLALAYAVSVAYYLKLLAAFVLRGIPGNTNVLSNWLVTTIIFLIAVIPFIGGLRKVEHIAHGTVSLKLGVIAGLLVALAMTWIGRGGVHSDIPVGKISGSNTLILLGLLITVQGFETSRYLGDSYDAQTRVKSMRLAQWISSATYLIFLALLTPYLGQAAKTAGVAGILDIMKSITPALAGLVLIGAVMSQVSAAVADSIGSAGLIVEVTKQRLKIAMGFATASLLAISVVWLTDPFQVIALSSRAFALYYALQCILGMMVAKRIAKVGFLHRLLFVGVGAICLLAAIAGAPAE